MEKGNGASLSEVYMQEGISLAGLDLAKGKGLIELLAK